MNALKCRSPCSVTVSILKFRLIRLTNIIKQKYHFGSGLLKTS